MHGYQTIEGERGDLTLGSHDILNRKSSTRYENGPARDTLCGNFGRMGKTVMTIRAAVT